MAAVFAFLGMLLISLLVALLATLQLGDFFLANNEFALVIGGVMLGAMLKAGNARLGLSQDDGKKGRDRVKGVGMRIYIEAADNIDEVAARAKAAGVTLQREPHDTDWGSRAFEVTEPSGFVLTIGSPSAT